MKDFFLSKKPVVLFTLAFGSLPFPDLAQASPTHNPSEGKRKVRTYQSPNAGVAEPQIRSHSTESDSATSTGSEPLSVDSSSNSPRAECLPTQKHHSQIEDLNIQATEITKKSHLRNKAVLVHKGRKIEVEIGTTRRLNSNNEQELRIIYTRGGEKKHRWVSESKFLKMLKRVPSKVDLHDPEYEALLDELLAPLLVPAPSPTPALYSVGQQIIVRRNNQERLATVLETKGDRVQLQYSISSLPVWEKQDPANSQIATPEEARALRHVIQKGKIVKDPDPEYIKTNATLHEIYSSKDELYNSDLNMQRAIDKYMTDKPNNRELMQLHQALNAINEVSHKFTAALEKTDKVQNHLEMKQTLETIKYSDVNELKKKPISTLDSLIKDYQKAVTLYETLFEAIPHFSSFMTEYEKAKSLSTGNQNLLQKLNPLAKVFQTVGKYDLFFEAQYKQLEKLRAHQPLLETNAEFIKLTRDFQSLKTRFAAEMKKVFD